MLQPCRFYDGELESFFCEECLVPCSALALAVGPHTTHKHRRLLDGLDNYPIRIWRDECEEYAKCVDHFIHNATSRMSSYLKQRDDAISAIQRIDESIAFLFSCRDQHLANLQVINEASTKTAVEETIAEAKNLLHVGKGRILHTLQTSLSPVIDNFPEYEKLRQEMHYLEERVIEEMNRLIHGGMNASINDEAEGIMTDLRRAEILTIKSNFTRLLEGLPNVRKGPPCALFSDDVESPVNASLDMSLSATAAHEHDRVWSQNVQVGDPSLHIHQELKKLIGVATSLGGPKESVSDFIIQDALLGRRHPLGHLQEEQTDSQIDEAATSLLRDFKALRQAYVAARSEDEKHTIEKRIANWETEMIAAAEAGGVAEKLALRAATISLFKTKRQGRI